MTIRPLALAALLLAAALALPEPAQAQAGASVQLCFTNATGSPAKYHYQYGMHGSGNRVQGRDLALAAGQTLCHTARSPWAGSMRISFDSGRECSRGFTSPGRDLRLTASGIATAPACSEN